MPADRLNELAMAQCRAAMADSASLDVRIIRYDHGGLLLDFGVDRLGTLRGGLQLSEICMAGQGEVTLQHASAISGYPLPFLQVVTDSPMAACIASQYAGWPFSTERFFSMCSGPARLVRGREEILTEYELFSGEREVVGILEANQLPDADDVTAFADQCGCDVANVVLCIARTSSLPGTMQVVARSVETALHKLHEIGFDLTRVQRAVGVAPLPPTGEDDYQAMGWTNDAILYGGHVTLWLSRVDDLYALVDRLPSCTSEEFGQPFIHIFEKYNRDFYRVDRMLFSPARVTLNSVADGKVVSAGQLRFDLLQSSFGWDDD